MPDLPYMELFPHVHPLNKDANVSKVLTQFDLDSEFSIPLTNQYTYVLPKNYLIPDKLSQVIAYLNAAFPGETILKKYENFTHSDMKPYGDKTRNLDYKDICFFWVYIAGGFLYLNAFIDDRNCDHAYKAKNAFAHSETLKELWIARQGQRAGITKTQDKKQAKKLFVFKLWVKHQKDWNKLSDEEKYKCLNALYEQNDGISKYGKFYAESSFTRSNASNFFTQFANMQKNS